MSESYVYESIRLVRIIVNLPKKKIVVSGLQNKTIANSFTLQKIMDALHNRDRDKNGCHNNDELKQALRDLGAYFFGWRAFGKANDSQISGEEVDTLVALENSHPSLLHQIIYRLRHRECELSSPSSFATLLRSVHVIYQSPILVRLCSRPVEEFSTKLSRVRSSHSSCPQSTQQLDDDDDLIRSQCWIDVVGGKKKEEFMGAGQLAANYSIGRGGLKHQPSSSSQHPDEIIVVLTQRLETHDQEYNELRQEFTTFKELVMRLLPESAVPQASHSQPTPVQPREVQPTHVQPIPVQTPSVQPHLSSQLQSLKTMNRKTIMKMIIIWIIRFYDYEHYLHYYYICTFPEQFYI
ncbi:hypothetical protein LR48_Vigan205s001200 [Vigna angularis]|uniref:EF-hand domain-containing protein n=1 Tax=Phaseolus angularis TaxID=3914 RepID=A0A0L9T5J6_PHAAN|nr:hypothetical protein LR48_Vigan205s001200 [Vigna angularis]